MKQIVMRMRDVDRKVNQIRKSIRTRKLMRHSNQMGKGHYPYYETISDEERHGMYNDGSHTEIKPKNSQEGSMFRSAFFYQLFGSIVLFFASFLVVNSDVQFFEKPEQLLRLALEDNFPFATVHDLYVEHLGKPLSLIPETETASSDIHNLEDLPLVGEVVESFSTNGTGIHIMPTSKSYVHAFNKGIVVFAGSRSDTDKTVVIQHADRSETTYGKLSSIDVHLYELVDVNDVIGSVNPEEIEETFYFSIEQTTGFVDPVEVINVDGTP